MDRQTSRIPVPVELGDIALPPARASSRRVSSTVTALIIVNGPSCAFCRDGLSRARSHRDRGRDVLVWTETRQDAAAAFSRLHCSRDGFISLGWSIGTLLHLAAFNDGLTHRAGWDRCVVVIGDPRSLSQIVIRIHSGSLREFN